MIVAQLGRGEMLLSDGELTKDSTIVMIVPGENDTPGVVAIQSDGVVTFYPTRTLAEEAEVLHDGLVRYEAKEVHWRISQSCLDGLRIVATLCGNAAMHLSGQTTVRRHTSHGVSMTAVATNGGTTAQAGRDYRG